MSTVDIWAIINGAIGGAVAASICGAAAYAIQQRIAEVMKKQELALEQALKVKRLFASECRYSPDAPEVRDEMDNLQLFTDLYLASLSCFHVVRRSRIATALHAVLTDLPAPHPGTNCISPEEYRLLKIDRLKTLIRLLA